MKHQPYIRHVAGAEKAVLFIHGFLGSPRHFDAFISRVPAHIAVYNILLEGHGKTVLDFANASMDGWKQQVETVMQDLLSHYQKVIIVAHSMGTLFAIELANRYPDRVESMFLLGVPFRICVKPVAAINTIKTLFHFVDEQDEVAKAYQNAHSVQLNLKFWQYLGWVPRYLELFQESRRGRREILKICVPCYIFQSAKDELVSIKSMRDIPKKEHIVAVVLKRSAHFIYDKEEFEKLLKAFEQLL